MKLDEIRQEVDRAAGHYYHSDLQKGIDNRTKQFVIQRCLPEVRGPHLLELGYIDGEWTRQLLELECQTLDVVEGAQNHVEHARETFGGDARVSVHHCLFQEFQPQRRFTTIIAGDMLRYLSDPIEFLKQAGSWLEPGGRIIVTVPNGRSFHRRLGAYMKMEASPMDANKRDQEVGNQRTYDRYTLRAELAATGLDVLEVRGCFFKPLSSAQMADWQEPLLTALYEMGNELEDYCWFLYAVCARR